MRPRLYLREGFCPN
ncbi:hypothetical protein D030_3401A, partial [Vibrio parahaemolyticus AQ3810]